MDTKGNLTESGATGGEGEHTTYTVDSFANGIAFGQQKLEPDMDALDYFSLRLKDDGELIRLRSRYLLHKNNPTHELERHLMRLSQQGLLSSATIYLGLCQSMLALQQLMDFHHRHCAIRVDQ